MSSRLDEVTLKDIPDITSDIVARLKGLQNRY